MNMRLVLVIFIIAVAVAIFVGRAKAEGPYTLAPDGQSVIITQEVERLTAEGLKAKIAEQQKRLDSIDAEVAVGKANWKKQIKEWEVLLKQLEKGKK